MLIKSFRKSLFSLCWLFASIAKGAACCGGGFAIPSLITGDDRAQFTSSLSNTKIDTDVFTNGVWQKRSGDDNVQVLKIEAAHIFKDRYQTGLSVPVQKRDRSGVQGGESSGLGDVSTQVGYEYLPDWNYNPWRPKGVGFLSLTLPTGKSIYESDDGSGIDSRGRGFWALGIGTVLTKSWKNWDANTTAEIHHAFEKSVHNSQLDGVIQPGNGGSLSLASGYSVGDLRLGGAVAWTYEEPIDIRGNNSSAGSLVRYATGTLSASYLFPESWAGTVSYSDQTWFGDPLNTSLSKSIALLLQKRWSR